VMRWTWRNLLRGLMVGALLTCAIAAEAGDRHQQIKNKDKVAYTVNIKCRGMQTSRNIRPQSTWSGGLPGPHPCTVAIAETGSTAIPAGHGSILVIKGGEFQSRK
jgi:hypothetical protein